MLRQLFRLRSRRAIAALTLCAVTFVVTAALAGAGSTPGGSDDSSFIGGRRPLEADESNERAVVLARDDAFISRRTAGTAPLDPSQAGALRAKAAGAAKKLQNEQVPSGPATFGDAWLQIGPNPIVQVTRGSGTFAAMAGRIGALAIRPSNGKFILGAAQGGIWLYDAASKTWSSKTADTTTQAIGSLAVAPSNDAIVYAGTGEGHLSGDSYFGDGILKSTNGGETWTKISSGDYFAGVAVSALAVDPTNASHLYAAALRGRGGRARTSPTEHARFGIWESVDGGVSWNLIQKTTTLGATDVEIDPLNPQVLFSSFWGDAIYKSTDGGKSWKKAMAGLPDGDFEGAQTRFNLGISHPSNASPAVLYTGFDWNDAAGAHQPARVFKSVNAGASWTMLPAGTGDDKVEDYCTAQCFYDNIVQVDPTNPNIVFVGGSFNYPIGSGGIYRSDDGGQTWKNLGWDQHPDFQALAFNPAHPAQVLVGSDGGVWTSDSRGGRPNASDPLDGVTWVDLNGSVDPGTAGVLARTNLSIAQFTSIATVPQIPPANPNNGSGRFWGGTQDNGTLRKTGGAAQQWFDVANGDGGQVIVDHTAYAAGTCSLAPSCFVYGTYFNISPYRYTDGGGFFTNAFIRNGLDQSERSDFYPPFVINRDNPNQLFFGTFRLYRTDNAKTPSAADVLWKPISDDLTTGCTGVAPNGARNCTISAIGVGGGEGVYVGTLDGLIQVSPDAQVSDTPTWVQSKDSDIPARPIAGFAVDRSNYRIAYAAVNGFDAATPGHPGHVLRTLDGGQTWTNISGNLPDTPVNSIVLDPSYPNTLYVGTDVGPFVTYNGGTDWFALGTGFPVISVWQLDLDPSHRLLAAGTHGRGAFSLFDKAANAAPALVLSKVDAGDPVGPASNVTYTLTLKNIGNAAATGITVTDPVPANTSFVSAGQGGTVAGGVVTWTVPTLAPGASVDLTFVVSIADALKKKVGSIVNDGLKATADAGFFTTGSPFATAIAPPYGFTLTPAAATDGGRVGTSVPYTLTIDNRGFNADSYSLSAASGWATSFYEATCTTPITTTTSVPAGGTVDVCVKVAVPAGAADGDTNTGTVTVTSVGNPAVSSTASLKTIAVVNTTLLVDNDNNTPDVRPTYTAALTAAGAAPFTTWDLSTDKNLPPNYTKAFKTIVWFTGNSYPAPVSPYEPALKGFLDNGGRLFMSGQDILDQGGGTTAFVHDYLHITWDGSETQNDKATDNVHGVATNPVSDGIATVPLDHSVLGAAFEDRLTLNGGALPAFTDDAGQTDGSTFAGTYKVVFLAFPLEAYGTAAQKADLLSRTLSFFGP